MVYQTISTSWRDASQSKMSLYLFQNFRYSENEMSYSRAFHTNGLMRTKLTPDNSKLIIATTGGYLMVVHNLNLTTLSKDLQV